MMEKQKFIWVMVVALLFAGMGVIAQSIDEDSLLAEEEMTLSDSIEGDLPTDNAGQDDLLAELLADDSDLGVDSDSLDADVPLDAIADGDGADNNAADDLGDLNEIDLGDAIEGIDAKAAVGVPAAEPVVEEPVLVEEKGVDPVEAIPEIDDSADMDALVDELADDTEVELGVEDIPVAVEPVAAVEAVEKPVEIAEKPVEIAEEPEVEYVDDMAIGDDVFKSLADEAKTDIAVGKAVLNGESSDLPATPVIEPESGVDDLIESLADEAEKGLDLSESNSSQSVVAGGPVVQTEGFAAVAGDPVAVKDAVVVNKSPEVAAFEMAERLKRIATEDHAKESVENAEKELAKKRYVSSIILFEEALEYLPNRDDLISWRNRARKGLAGASYLRALSLERMGEFEKAKTSALDSVKYGYRRGEDAVKRIQAEIETPPIPTLPQPKLRQDEPDYIQTEKEIKAWLKRGREAFLTGEYERAILNFESVLARDPENKEAMRLKRNASQKRYDRSSAERDGTRVSMMTEVIDAWSQKRKYGEYETPIDNLGGRRTKTTSIDDKKSSDVIKKMEDIRIPEVDFRQANIRDVVKFLHDQSIEFDPSENPDERKGVNIILKLGASEKAEAVAEAPDPWGDAADDGADTGGGAAGGETFITFSALDITLKEALDIVVDIANLKYLIRGNIVKIMPKNAATSDIEHRMYNVLSSAIGRLEELSQAVKSNTRGGGDFMGIEGTGDLGGQEVDLKVFFAEMGVEWPEKSSIKYVRSLGKLVVANTLENLTVFEKVLKVLNVVPYQIEIEARFVEVAQTDVDSLGLEWMLNDNWEIAEKKSDAGKPLAARERLIVNENAGGGGFTRGNRFVTDLTGDRSQNLADDLLSFTSILTNPELTVILHAMQQQGHSDLLSAPKITTQSGQQATIKVVTEYIYPTEYTLIEAHGSGGDNAGIAPPAVEPGSFETREVGVILDVLPEVSPDGQMINLTLSPEVVTEPVWHDYGYDYFLGNMGGGVVTTHLRMEQPFFHSRSLQTNLLIYNGATVVMGGMITEVREDVDDKIPILGDIPILGHLFRSRYEASEKRNLLIFVTARLVDPSGRPLNSDKFGIDGTIAAKIAANSEDAAE